MVSWVQTGYRFAELMSSAIRAWAGRRNFDCFQRVADVSQWDQQRSQKGIGIES
jgi:hypothetical protein